MSFNARKFYEDHGIDYYSGNYPHKHTRPGWIQIECPCCTGNPGLHLGFHEEQGFFVCYRCGWHPNERIIQKLIDVPWKEAKRVKREYGGRTTITKAPRRTKEKDITVKLPLGSRELQENHRKYLENRGFDPDELDDIWDLYGTPHIGPYKMRIIAPIYYRDKLVSYQGRDITGLSQMKYKACSKKEERIHHKDVVYGYDLVRKDAVLVEGIFDVWRLGPGAIATFGIMYTESQLNLLSKLRRVFILYDEGDSQAMEQAEKLCCSLNLLGTESEIITTGKTHDPGEYSKKEAEYLMRELLIK